MFYPQFSKSDYEEREWLAVYMLEHLLRCMVSRRAEVLVGCSEAMMVTHFEGYLSHIGFPPAELKDREGLAARLIRAEHANVQAFAREIAECRPQGEEEIARVLCANGHQYLESMKKCEDMSSTFRDGIASQRILSWMEEMGQRSQDGS